jgi:hypothetical protein
LRRLPLTDRSHFLQGYFILDNQLVDDLSHAYKFRTWEADWSGHSSETSLESPLALPS